MNDIADAKYYATRALNIIAKRNEVTFFRKGKLALAVDSLSMCIKKLRELDEGNTTDPREATTKEHRAQKPSDR
jgi:hypothetical protein